MRSAEPFRLPWRLFATLLTLAARLASQEVAFEGTPIQVNETWFGPQWHARIAASSEHFLVVWSGPGEGVGLEIFGRSFDAFGPTSKEFQLSEQGTVAADYPVVVSCPNGKFVVAWMASSGIPGAIWARAVLGPGLPGGSPFLISPQGYQLGEYFDVACTSDNELLVGWYSPFAPPYPGFNVLQRFDLNGAPLSSPVPVDSGKWGVSGISAILPRPDGGALLLWEIYSPPSELTTVLRVFNGDLLPDSEETLLALHENTCWLMDAYSVLPDELAIAYDCYFPESYPRQARFASFDLSSGELVAEHLVEHDAGAGTMRPRAARLPGGAGIGAWNLVSNNAPGAIQLTTFDRRIVPLQPTAPVPTDPAFGASEVDIAALAGGNAGWVLWNSYGEDGSIDGVFAQRFDIVAPSIVEIPASSGVSLSGLAVILAASAVLALRRRRNNPG